MPVEYYEHPRETETTEPARAPGQETLPLLYQGILTVIVRLQTGKQRIGDAQGFQRRMEELLVEIEREAIKSGYRKQDIDDAHYAVIAFLDETIYSSDDPERKQWNSLGAKLYSQAIAGEGLFERLRTIRVRRDSSALADLLEVYYLCFALGYEGRYAVDGRAEFQSLMIDIKEHIERIRGHREALSPWGARFSRKPSAAATDPLLRGLQAAAVLSLGVASLTWAASKILLLLGTRGFPQ